MKVWVILPAFNEAENLPALLDGLAAVLRLQPEPYGIVLVDDGSGDATRATAETYATRLPVEVVVHEQNLGLARTVQTGIRHVLRRARDDDIIVTMDADNTHPPELVESMLEAIRRGADIVIASRYAQGGGEVGVPPLRRVLSYGIGTLMRLRFGLRGVRDYSSGYRAYRAHLLRAALDRYGAGLVEARGFAVMAELLVKLQAFDPRIVEIPLELRYDRKRGASKLRILSTISDYVMLLVAPHPRTQQTRRDSRVGTRGSE